MRWSAPVSAISDAFCFNQVAKVTITKQSWTILQLSESQLLGAHRSVSWKVADKRPPPGSLDHDESIRTIRRVENPI